MFNTLQCVFPYTFVISSRPFLSVHVDNIGIAGTLKLLCLVLSRSLLASVLWRGWQRLKKLCFTASSTSSTVSYYVLLTMVCTPALTRRFRRTLFTLFAAITTTTTTATPTTATSTTVPPLRAGVFHGGLNTSSALGAVQCRLEEKVEQYWITPFLNGTKTETPPFTRFARFYTFH